MSIGPLPVRRPGEQLIAAAAARVRRAPTRSGMARRRFVITATKWLLPALALMLLASIALWPEIKRVQDQTQVTIARMAREFGGVTLQDAGYKGVDEHGRPYTVTAATAQQDGPSRINLTLPKGDMTLQNGTWLMVNAKRGVYLQQTKQLDLSDDVTFYRDDGTTLVTASASFDLDNGAAASSEPTHAEGPFGTLDAQGFTITDKGAAVQFIGPAHLVLNGATP